MVRLLSSFLLRLCYIRIIWFPSFNKLEQCIKCGEPKGNKEEWVVNIASSELIKDRLNDLNNRIGLLKDGKKCNLTLDDCYDLIEDPQKLNKEKHDLQYLWIHPSSFYNQLKFRFNQWRIKWVKEIKNQE